MLLDNKQIDNFGGKYAMNFVQYDFSNFQLVLKKGLNIGRA